MVSSSYRIEFNGPCTLPASRTALAANSANSTLLKWDLLSAANHRSWKHFNWRQKLSTIVCRSPKVFPAAKSPRRCRCRPAAVQLINFTYTSNTVLISLRFSLGVSKFKAPYFNYFLALFVTFTYSWHSSLESHPFLSIMQVYSSFTLTLELKKKINKPSGNLSLL